MLFGGNERKKTGGCQDKVKVGGVDLTSLQDKKQRKEKRNQRHERATGDKTEN